MNPESIRKYCLSLPSVTEGVKWEADLCFMIDGKMFCVIPLEGEFGCSLKVLPEDFEELTARPGIIPAPYLSRAGWIRVLSASALSQPEWKKLIRTSYELIAAKLSKKRRAELGLNA